MTEKFTHASANLWHFVGMDILTSSVAATLPLAHDFVAATGCCWLPLTVFFVTVPRGSSAGSRFLFFGGGGAAAAEEVLAESA